MLRDILLEDIKLFLMVTCLLEKNMPWLAMVSMNGQLALGITIEEIMHQIRPTHGMVDTLLEQVVTSHTWQFIYLDNNHGRYK